MLHIKNSFLSNISPTFQDVHLFSLKCWWYFFISTYWTLVHNPQCTMGMPLGLRKQERERTVLSQFTTCNISSFSFLLCRSENYVSFLQVSPVATQISFLVIFCVTTPDLNNVFDKLGFDLREAKEVPSPLHSLTRIYSFEGNAPS